jgi:hypothetical protein
MLREMDARRRPLFEQNAHVVVRPAPADRDVTASGHERAVRALVAEVAERLAALAAGRAAARPGLGASGLDGGPVEENP